MKKRDYLKLLEAQSVAFLVSSMQNPTGHMRPIHIALHKVALRRRAEYLSRQYAAS